MLPQKKTVRIKGNNQDWFDNEVHEAIRKRDKLFSKFKKTRLDIDNQNYNESRNLVQRLIIRFCFRAIGTEYWETKRLLENFKIQGAFCENQF